MVIPVSPILCTFILWHTVNMQRRLGLFQSTVLNMIDMVGIGPFITLPIVMGLIGGMYLYAWIAGAILSLVDAMIWSELGAAYPLAGGSYHFLKESYGKEGAGRMMSFLYVWILDTSPIGCCIRRDRIRRIFRIYSTVKALAAESRVGSRDHIMHHFIVQEN